MAHRDEVGRALGGHDARDACGGEHVAFGRAALDDHREGLGTHRDGRRRNGTTARVGLGGHIDHAGLAALVEVREPVVATATCCRVGCVNGGVLGRRGGVRRHPWLPSDL